LSIKHGVTVKPLFELNGLIDGERSHNATSANQTFDCNNNFDADFRVNKLVGAIFNSNKISDGIGIGKMLCVRRRYNFPKPKLTT
jgi:hypothetical protein